MNEFIKGQKEKFSADAIKLQARRQEWPDFEKRAVELIKAYIEDAKKSEHYEFFYVITDKDIPNIKTTNQSFIQFYAGSHPTGISTTTKDPVKKMTSLSGVTEKSGCLSIIQEPKGGVFFIVFPSESEVLKWADDYVVLKYFKSPREIEWHEIREAIEFYFRFSRYTSIYSEQTTMEKIELWWIKFKFSSIISYIFKGASFTARLLTSAKTGIPLVGH